MNASLLSRDSKGTTAGDLAAAKGHLTILKMIIDIGVDIKINKSDTWLHHALRNGHFPTAEFLIQSSGKLLVRDLKGMNSEDLEVSQLVVLKKMVEEGWDVNINKTENPWLYQALRNGHNSTAEFLIRSGAKLLGKSLKGMNSEDLEVSQLNILKKMVEEGWDVNINKTENPWLYQALRNGHSSTAEFLIRSGAKLLGKSLKGMNSEDLEVSQLNILKKMVEEGWDVNINKTENPWLYQALRNGHSSTAEFLIRSGAKLLGKSSKGTNAEDLEVALLNILKKLVEAGWDVNINKTDPWLHQALRNGHNTIAEFLIKSGADVDAKSSENQTAFEEAVLRGSDAAIILLHQAEADIHTGRGSKSRLQESISNGNEIVFLPTAEGLAAIPLSYPVEPGTAAVAKLFLDYGAEVHSISRFKNILAILDRGEELPEVVVQFHYGSDIHAMSLSHEPPATTVLSVLEYDDDSILQLLLEKRTNPKGRHLWERTLIPAMTRKTNENVIMSLLREWGPISTA